MPVVLPTRRPHKTLIRLLIGVRPDTQDSQPCRVRGAAFR